MTYPFEFHEMLLTDKALDVLGFSEYWAGCGDFGHRSFGIEYVSLYRIWESDELDDPEMGYGLNPIYQPKHYRSNENKRQAIYFLHELYEDIAENKPDLLQMFVNKTKEKGVNMYYYIESYLEWKYKNVKQ